MATNDLKEIYTTTNSGVMYLGRSKDSIILSSASELTNQKKYQFEKLEKNFLYMINEDCEVTTELLQKKMTIQRQPKRGYNHIVEEEIFESVDSIN